MVKSTDSFQEYEGVLISTAKLWTIQSISMKLQIEIAGILVFYQLLSLKQVIAYPTIKDSETHDLTSTVKVHAFG